MTPRYRRGEWATKRSPEWLLAVYVVLFVVVTGAVVALAVWS